ncbi:MAG: RNA polymerase factor sigma-54 [Rickettsiales bacterium]
MNSHKANAPKLELRQGQSLIMTQSLQQSIKLLQCNSLELREFVEQALEENPFLSQDEISSSEEKIDSDDNKAKESSEEEDDNIKASDENHDVGEWSEDWDDSYDIDRDNINYSQESSANSSSYNSDEYNKTIEDNPANSLSLREHMLNQLQIEINDPTEKLIGAYLIDLLDESGYIKDDPTQISEVLGVEVKEIENILESLKKFDPTGVCAKDLKECLSLQLREKGRFDPAIEKLLNNLDLLADSKFDELRKKCGVDKEDLKDMISEIRALNPKPSSNFIHEVTQAIEPDIFVRRLTDDSWHIELNMNNFPKVMVNKRFYKTVSEKTKNKKDKEYLSEKFNSANWLIKALEQRAQTMLKVSGELIKQQDAFFRLGVRYLKPMTLKDIAAATDYHESTISRVTNGKFLTCQRGTFELKYFFTSSLTRAQGSGDNFSSQSVKHLIAEMIEKEELNNILLDDDIVEKLKENNINIARRTVAKYRESLSIPSSAKRKRIKQNIL